MEKEKKIGSVSINLADYVRADSPSSSEELTVRMTVPGEDRPAVVTLSVVSKCYNGTDMGDSMSDISGLNIETSSATSQASLNSIEEDEDDDNGDVIMRPTSESPEPAPQPAAALNGSSSPRTAIPAQPAAESRTWGAGAGAGESASREERSHAQVYLT